MLEKLSDNDGVGVIIVAERAGGGDSGVYQKSSLKYLYPEDDGAGGSLRDG